VGSGDGMKEFVGKDCFFGLGGSETGVGGSVSGYMFAARSSLACRSFLMAAFCLLCSLSNVVILAYFSRGIQCDFHRSWQRGFWG